MNTITVRGQGRYLQGTCWEFSSQVESELEAEVIHKLPAIELSIVMVSYKDVSNYSVLQMCIS